MNAGRTLHVRTPDEQAQEDLGARLAAASGSSLLVFIDGELGAGKTTLVRGWLRGLGHVGAVKSPTYTLIEPYSVGGRSIYHLDLYRVADPEELEYLGLRELLAEHALVLIEWPQRGSGWLPEPDLQISIRHAASGRDVTLRASGAIGSDVLRRLEGNLESYRGN